MNKNYFETILGGCILTFSIFFLFIFLKSNSSDFKKEVIEIKAKFLKVGGVVSGNDVKIRGVKVGTVSKVNLDNDFFAVVHFFINKNLKISSDSSISVNSEGILGGKYLSIIPGSSGREYLVNGDEIKEVIDYESIEDQVSKIIFLATQ
tara:strand:+ start:270 stop:716 length:447 start_codon:yes stop_codon:yes gene_type:complete